MIFSIQKLKKSVGNLLAISHILAYCVVFFLIAPHANAQSGSESPHIQFSKPIINDAKILSSADPLKSILDQHKGKVIYIDIWATWCLPCLFEMPSSKKLREKLNGSCVAFVYLCINSDDEKRWRKLIVSKKINGENYFLSPEQSTALTQKFNITSIPRYMLFDKDGECVSDNARPPREPIVLKTIRDLLK